MFSIETKPNRDDIMIQILQQAAPSILVPEMVALEVNRRGEHDPTARAVATTSWISSVATPGVPDAERAPDDRFGRGSRVLHQRAFRLGAVADASAPD
ncbi:MAG: hypothetical protein KFB96_06730 [Thiocapsa sp.]|uniref:hypothetical protein n=1 Tax=Thiocapsa sp. TaxID=2024551 RepID=UPI001BD17B7B|nr:hypothetical protein [Thiocapsa sp.]QVL50152.1 MAG: hypothetical protein KFB96_06730 [Thiocapsa sp.]